MLNEASLTALREKLLSSPKTLTPHECAFLATLLTNYVTGVKASELYLTPVLQITDELAFGQKGLYVTEPRPSITQPIIPDPALTMARAGFRALPDAGSDFPQSNK
jgi:hypothetical protein